MCGPDLNHLRRSLCATRAVGTVAAIGLASLPAVQARAQTAEPGYNLYGTTGLIDMPTGESQADAELAGTVAGFPKDIRMALTFQVTPRLSGTFRYAGFDQDVRSGEPGTRDNLTWDRSLDARFELFEEGYLFPSLLIGLQDLAGTGLLSSEYLVATKHFTRNLTLTAGLGWGRMGSANTIFSIGTRRNNDFGEGGTPAYDQWFRGDVGLFGGLAWQMTDALKFKLELSSDAYENASNADEFDRNIPWNFGFDYRFDNGTQASVYALYGSTIGAQVTFTLNPKDPPIPGGREQAPLPVLVRSPEAIADTSWVAAPPVDYEAELRSALQRDGLVLDGLLLEPHRAVLRFENPLYGEEPEAIGRAARMMSRTLPASVEIFEIVPVSNGMALSAITIRRTDLEDYAFEDAAAIRPLVDVADGFGALAPTAPDRFPDFEWAVTPYVATGWFDPDTPVRADVGVRGIAQLRPTRNTLISGSVAKRIAGNLADTTADNSGPLHPVRTDFPSYLTEGDPGIESLTGSIFAHPAEDFYSRLTVGYLESMFGGVDGEVLWKRVDSRLAIGAELGWVQQRDFDRLFGFQDYSVMTGFLTTYYDFPNGFQARVAAGQYLAGDRGATIGLDRQFDNGWLVGAFATFTNVSAADFGEGSFDKGIVLVIPTSWVLGSAERSSIDMVIRPILRNGGAVLNVQNRLYPIVRDYHEPVIDAKFGRFWR